MGLEYKLEVSVPKTAVLSSDERYTWHRKNKRVWLRLYIHPTTESTFARQQHETVVKTSRNDSGQRTGDVRGGDQLVLGSGDCSIATGDDTYMSASVLQAGDRMSNGNEQLSSPRVTTDSASNLRIFQIKHAVSPPYLHQLFGCFGLRSRPWVVRSPGSGCPSVDDFSQFS